MPRTPDPLKRAELLHALAEHLHEHGIAELSLEPLARAVGTSKRMLLYYFGDRGSLIAEVLSISRPDVGRLFEGASDRDGLHAACRALWHAVSRGEQHRSIRMLLQVLALSTTRPEPYAEFAADAVHVMTGPVSAAFERAGWPPAQAASRATLVVSGLRGLCQDLLVTGDDARVDHAAEDLLKAVVA